MNNQQSVIEFRCRKKECGGRGKPNKPNENHRPLRDGVWLYPFGLGNCRMPNIISERTIFLMGRGRALNRVERRASKVLRYARTRCDDPKAKGFSRYGGRGIKNYLTRDDLVTLWIRDGADKMERPSIDRKDNDGHYTFENCRFIELGENSRRAHQKPCPACGVLETGKFEGLCRSCYLSQRLYCIRCKTEARPKRGLICDKCRWVKRPCAYCGTVIVRDRGKSAGTVRNKQWFCSKREHGAWLGKTYGKGCRRQNA